MVIVQPPLLESEKQAIENRIKHFLVLSAETRSIQFHGNTQSAQAERARLFCEMYEFLCTRSAKRFMQSNATFKKSVFNKLLETYVHHDDLENAVLKFICTIFKLTHNQALIMCVQAKTSLEDFTFVLPEIAL